MVGTVPAGLLMGGGWLALTGVRQLIAFSGPGAYTATLVLTVLGALPAILVGFGAAVAIPAMIGAWTTGMVARPKVGYALDAKWAEETAPKLVPTGPATTPTVQPLLTVPLP
jgi:hypothetical protein